jgi:ribosomal protein RSM22 (predicted rRNA methylase)
VTSLPADLAAALDDALASARTADLTRAVDALVVDYRDGAHRGAVTEVAAAAYAAYRMPATFGAVRAVAAALAALSPSFAPRTLLDVGGGTGAAVWAVAEALPSLSAATVLEPDRAMADLGRRLASLAGSTAVQSASWVDADVTGGGALPAVDLAVASYSLGELAEPARLAAVRRLAAVAHTVAIVEPGTPRGYRTVLAARDVLVDAGLRVVAPCPHSAECPLRDGADWCHFAVRVERTPLHRRVKRAALGYEDEKFSYVVASATGAAPAAGRLIRHPQHRKGHTLLQVCREEGEIVETTIAKSDRAAYRTARDAKWGDAWPPPDLTPPNGLDPCK